MMKQLLQITIVLLIMYSCSNQEPDKEKIDEKDIEVVSDSIISNLIEDQKSTKLPEPFKVIDIERLDFTSGGGFSVVKNGFCDTLNNGFFGMYFLIDRDFSDERGIPVGGTITVHVNGKMKGWRADDTTQTIWEINLESDMISVWDSIHVGLTRAKIVQFGEVNNGFCIEMDDFDYLCDFNNFSVVYNFINDTLTELTVTRNCEKELK